MDGSTTIVDWPLPGPEANPWPVWPSWVVIGPSAVTPGSRAMAWYKVAANCGVALTVGPIRSMADRWKPGLGAASSDSNWSKAGMPVVPDSRLLGQGRCVCGERRHVDQLPGPGDGVGRRGAAGSLQALVGRRGVRSNEQVEPDPRRLLGRRGELGRLGGKSGAGLSRGRRPLLDREANGRLGSAVVHGGEYRQVGLGVEGLVRLKMGDRLFCRPVGDQAQLVTH